MNNHRLFQLTAALLIFLGIPSFCGCATVKQLKADHEARKKEVVRQKESYLELKRNIHNGKLKLGDLSHDIKEIYGPPADIFYSNSNGNSFQIWTYNIAKDKLSNESFDPILLYINNEKLINWKY